MRAILLSVSNSEKVQRLKEAVALVQKSSDELAELQLPGNADLLAREHLARSWVLLLAAQRQLEVVMRLERNQAAGARR